MIHNSGNYVSNTGTIGRVTQQQGAPAQSIPVPGAGAAPPAGEARYDVALSYAGEQERLVSRVAKLLEAEGLRIFFAPYRDDVFIGEDMYARFYQIYRYQSRYVAAFVTADYLRKEITMHEAATAMLRRRDDPHLFWRRLPAQPGPGHQLHPRRQPAGSGDCRQNPQRGPQPGPIT